MPYILDQVSAGGTISTNGWLLVSTAPLMRWRSPGTSPLRPELGVIRGIWPTQMLRSTNGVSHPGGRPRFDVESGAR
jgi:hypothetical protein